MYVVIATPAISVTIRLLDVERRHLRGRQDEEFVALHELRDAVTELVALRLRLGDVVPTSAARRDRSPKDRVLHLRPVLPDASRRAC